ncbi:MAG: dihydrolipoyl dehydrogenase [Desulfobacterales bacterium]
MVVGELAQETELLVIGGGPGGYAAAFRAADLGLDVTLLDVRTKPGGECLFQGCIPSKALLFLAELIHDAGRSGSMGVVFDKPRIDLDKIRAWKGKVVDTLTNGLVTLSNKRGVQLVKGQGAFEGSDRIRVRDSDVSRIKFRHAILATGSFPKSLPGIEFKPSGRIMNSAGALELPDIPKSLLIIGGGYIGLELGTVYAALGSKITLVEMEDSLLPGVDPDLVKPLAKRVNEIFKAIHLSTRVVSINELDDRVETTFEGEVDNPEQSFDRVLVAIGRQSNSENLGLETTGVNLDDNGFVIVDEQQRTSDERIFAIGDITGAPQLAHRASHQGKVAAEVIAGQPSAFDARVIPAIVYTDPQIAWCGLTEEQARKRDRSIRVEHYPWKLSGRATTMGATDGMTKIIVDPETQRVLGVGIVGRDAEGMISEGALAIEMGALLEDLALTIHPHPTLSESLSETADMFLGRATHVIPKKQ